MSSKHLSQRSRRAATRASRKTLRAALAAALSALLFAAASPGRAVSARPASNTLTVTNTNDSGAGSLRQAIADAAANDTINFNLPAGSTITAPNAELLIDKNLTIAGPGAASLAVSTGRQRRVFRVTSGVTASISGLTIRDGFNSVATDAVNIWGGGIRNSGTLTLDGCVVTGNSVRGARLDLGDGAGGGIANFGTLTLKNSTVSNNQAFSNGGTEQSGSGSGGGIYNDANATLILTDSSVTFNGAFGADNFSGGIPGGAAGGGIYNLGILVMTNSAVSGNSTGAGGATFPNNASSVPDGSGGGVENFGTMTADRSTFANNIALGGFIPAGGGAGLGGGVNNRPAGTLALANCAFKGNMAQGLSSSNAGGAGSGGGLNNLGSAALSNITVSDNVARGGNCIIVGGPANGGGVASTASLTLTNSTLSGNEAQGGFGAASTAAGKATGGGLYAEGTLTLTNCTVTRNAAAGGGGQTSSAEGGGVAFVGAGTARPLNTIIAANDIRGNSFGGVSGNTLTAPDVSGTFASQGHNLVGRNDGAAASFPAGQPNASSDIVGTGAAPVDPVLGPLANNGGPTQTHRPWQGSPAIEGGDNAVLFPPFNLSTDQRGPGFPRLFNSKVDIGAVEVRDNAITLDLQVPSGVVEGIGSFNVSVTRTGDLAAGDVTVDISVTGGTASPRSDFKESYGTLRFASGEASKTFTVFITDDSFAEPDETVSVRISNPTGGAALGVDAATLTINDNEVTTQPSNPIDDTTFFVRQHYVDFLNREPDPSGLVFWVNEIESCGADAQCREVKRINVSAAFFLSIENQQTGFFALRARRAAFGKRSASAAARVTLAEYLRDAQQLGEGVVGGVGAWAQTLEQNKADFLRRLVESSAYRARYPETQTAAQYVDALFASAGVTPDVGERNIALGVHGWGGAAGRAAALRNVAELASVTSAETNPAFVLSEYFGYLRRNPTDAPDSNDSGYQFWLSKLNQFNGNYIQAEMVKAFISSTEYRQRFGPR